LLGDAHEAEDVAQDTFIRAFRALHTFDTTRSLRPWLLTIASNLSHNKRRSVGRYLGALRRFYSEPEPVAHLGERSGQQWEAQTLWQAVKRLNPHEQEVVYLRYFLEMSEAEMARTLQVAPGTVKSRLHRALNRLRKVVDVEFPALREERQT
jgi:RNA polymerase sigma-70 factor (ECF subfamily)